MNKFTNIFKDNPLFSDLSVDVVSCTEASLIISVTELTSKKNELGVVSGSFALSFFDTAVGFFIVNKNDALRSATIFNYNMNIFSPLKGDNFFVEVSQLSHGTNVCAFQIDCYVMRVETKRLLASGQIHAYISLKKSLK
ncbi:hypothetical protein [Gilvimarinus chinensis]|uniref:hypothetical protein n=1 Tax=Gilvimarinus chinensis TaxID=396005 RepID=UPI00036AB2DD|nr:hypothetical protein [Gilvimarinus chinensis]